YLSPRAPGRPKGALCAPAFVCCACLTARVASRASLRVDCAAVLQVTSRRELRGGRRGRFVRPPLSAARALRHAWPLGHLSVLTVLLYYKLPLAESSGAAEGGALCARLCLLRVPCGTRGLSGIPPC